MPCQDAAANSCCRWGGRSQSAGFAEAKTLQEARTAGRAQEAIWGAPLSVFLCRLNVLHIAYQWHQLSEGRARSVCLGRTPDRHPEQSLSATLRGLPAACDAGELGAALPTRSRWHAHIPCRRGTSASHPRGKSRREVKLELSHWRAELYPAQCSLVPLRRQAVWGAGLQQRATDEGAKLLEELLDLSLLRLQARPCLTNHNNWPQVQFQQLQIIL